MGTSQSSSGPGGGVPLVPPWADEPPPGDGSPDIDAPNSDPTTPPDESASDAPNSGNDAGPTAPATPAIAPARRFANARTQLGKFASSGDRQRLRSSFGHYVRSGYGGTTTATRRFGRTASTASSLHTVLSGGDTSTGGFDRDVLRGRSADEVMDAVVEAVRPVDGTQDAEASRAAIRDSLSELLGRFPDADLLDLNEEQRNFAIERYVAADVFRRYQLDVGQTIQDKAPSATTALSRLKMAKDYVKQAVAASFRKLAKVGQMLTAGRVSQVVRGVLRDTFEVFEGHIL